MAAKDTTKLFLILIGPILIHSAFSLSIFRIESLKVVKAHNAGGRAKMGFMVAPTKDPKKVATPLPPENPKKGEYMWPSTANKQLIGACLALISAGIMPLPKSNKATIAVTMMALRLPCNCEMVRYTFVEPGFFEP